MSPATSLYSSPSAPWFTVPATRPPHGGPTAGPLHLQSLLPGALPLVSIHAAESLSPSGLQEHCHLLSEYRLLLTDCLPH